MNKEDARRDDNSTMMTGAEEWNAHCDRNVLLSGTTPEAVLELIDDELGETAAQGVSVELSRFLSWS